MTKKNYLEKMGVTTWHLREKNPAENYFCVMLNNAAGKAVGMLLADCDKTVSIDEQEKLLQKIAQALTSNIVEVRLIEFRAAEAHFKFIILLGDQIKKIIKKNKLAITPDCQIIESYSLKEFIQNAEHKKALWSAIKPLCDLLA